MSVNIEAMFDPKMEFNTVGLSIKITQSYKPEFNSGHYTAVIEDAQGNIVFHTESMASGPNRKMDMNDVFELIERFKRDYKDTEDYKNREREVA
jgi:hypothetical protein